MSLLLRAEDLIGLPVVPIDSGEDIAEIRDVVFDPQHHGVVGFTLNKRGRLAGTLDRFLAADDVIAAGPHAVMVERADVLAPPAVAPDELTATPRSRAVEGNRVISEDGVELGEVTGVIVLAGSRLEVVGYEIAGPRWKGTASGRGYVPVAAQVAVSGEALIVPSEAVDFVRDDLVGFASAVDEFRARLGEGRWTSR